MKKKFIVKGMSCASCVAHVEKAVKKLNDANDVNVSLLNNSLELETTTLTDEEIMKAVKKAGFKISREDNSYLNESNIKKSRLIVSVILLILLLYIAMEHMMNLPLPEFLLKSENALYFALTQVIILIPIIVLNFNYFSSGYTKLIRKSPNMDSLVAVGSSASILYGIFAIVMICIGISNKDYALVEKYKCDLYFESAGTILTVVSIGKYLESRSKGKTSQAIKMLLELSGKDAIVIRNQKEEVVSVDEILKDDVVKVVAGSSVPVDGIIIEGYASFNESNITGESIPIHKEAKDKVISGSVNLDGVVLFKATTTSKDSTIAKIVEMVQTAASSKAPIARLADKISAKFVPVVMLLSALSFILWIIFSNNLELSLSIGISVLVVSCPCALGLATPLAIMIATGVAARKNILIKDAKTLEALSHIDTVVFDKTGTITTGNLQVVDVVSSDNNFLNIVGSLEKKSNHPLALAINKYVLDHNVEVFEVQNHTTIPGKGIEGTIKDRKYFLGNKKYIEEKINKKIDFIDTNNSIMILASEEVLGYITISDEIKQTTKETIKLFRNNNIKTVMLTGDNSNNANYVKELINIDEVIAEVLPDQKGQVIKQLQEKGNVLMIGDGINDAVALESANVSMAIGNGSDIAISSANIILTNNDIYQSYVAYELSKKTIKNIKYSLFWAFFYNIICIPVACGILYPFIGVKFNPMLASIAMSLSSICVVLNALRLLKFKVKKGIVK